MAARGPYAKGLAKREEILEVALAHFAERGYDRASVREVARLAGLTQAGLLHHFSSKEELFLAVLQQRDDRLEKPDEPRHTHSVGRLIEAVERNAFEPGLVRLFVSMSAESVESDGPARAFFEERYGWLRGELHADVSHRQDNGDFAPDLDPDDVASLLIAVADGLQLQWLLDPANVDMSRLLRVLWDALKRVPSPAESAELR
jgi:AcrR family transcriptional regulator